MVDVANHYLSDVDEVRHKLLPNLCQFVSLFPEDHQKMLLHTLIRERLESEGSESNGEATASEKAKASQKSESMRVELLSSLFDKFDVTQLVDNEFHKYLYTSI